MKRLFTYTLAILLLTSAAHAADVSDLYRQRKYDQIILLLKDLSPAAHNEESLYYLALSHVQKGHFEKAKEILLGLLAQDPSFYVYRLGFDLDFEPLFRKTDLKRQISKFHRGAVLAKRPFKGHEIVKTQSGLHLYRNGVKITLAIDTEIQNAGFLGDDVAYFIVSHNKNLSIVLNIYSGREKRKSYERLLGKIDAITARLANDGG